MFQDLQDHLTLKISELKGSWIRKNSGYDKYICEILEMNLENGRYYDATWNEFFIEFKKGKSIWLDLIRYSETILLTNDEASHDTINLFFIPNKTKDQIETIICVETKQLISKLELDKESAKKLLEIDKLIPHHINAQARLTIKEITENYKPN
ncbi:MAG: hypothetical protein NWF07_13110 [Candidatus Bathyarchaeota archaeon]|nr:hypothetical protein [Candidatus Bathyarchaeota archaeon]